VVGCDFRVASSQWRSRVVLDDSEAREIALSLRRNGAADGFLDLNTCNRNEWIVSGPDPQWATELLRTHMMQRAGPKARDWLRPYVHLGDEAARHVFRVAIGQESLVVGERQIASQLYRALEQARSRKISSRVLNGLGSISGRLVRIALRRGCIASAAVGVHSLAVDFLRERFRERKTVRVAVVGQGRIGRRVLGLLEEDLKFKTVCCNRTVSDDQSGRLRPLTELSSILDEVDAAVVCTGALKPVINLGDVQGRSADQPLLLVDIGIPEQVERSASTETVEVAGLDQLTSFHRDKSNCSYSVVDTNEAEGLVQRAVEEFRTFCNQQAFSEILDTVQRHHRQLVGEEIPRLVVERFEYLGSEARSQLELDLKNIVLDYTNEVFRTIKEVSKREGEEGLCPEEN
jgi:glutamyl-tRNA reductase